MGGAVPLSGPTQDPLEAGRARIHVLIADETPMGCQLLEKAITQSRYRFEVVACAIDRPGIIEAMNGRHVDIVVLSLSLRDGPFMGFRALSDLHVSFPSTRVVVLLKSAPDDLVVDAFRAGAKGVLSRTEPVEVLCKCLHAVHKGQIWANSHQLHFVLEALITANPLRVLDSRGRRLLTKREDEVVNLVAEGMTNREVAQKLDLSEHTVSNYLLRIYEKLGISSRIELVLYVLKQRGQI